MKKLSKARLRELVRGQSPGLRYGEAEMMAATLLKAADPFPVGYLTYQGDAVTRNDFQGGEGEMHNTAAKEGWKALIVVNALIPDFPQLLGVDNACPSNDITAVAWVRTGDANHAADVTLDPDVAREWMARGLTVIPTTGSNKKDAD